MKVSIIGGNFGDNPKQSSIINKMSSSFSLLKNDVQSIIMYNGGNLDSLPEILIDDLVIWMPNIDNENRKQYPNKKNGTVMICSKVMREGYTNVDAVSRVFKMHANAVIAIYDNNGIKEFKLIDALGNIWIKTTDISILINAIIGFYYFTKKAVRINSKQLNSIIPPITNFISDIEKITKFRYDLHEFIQINNSLASYIQLTCGDRFFGNLSTRCQKLFPTAKCETTLMHVSPRNSDKKYLEVEDFVPCYYINDNEIGYYGDKKPSVDSPVQLKIYNNFPDINFMIHGHAFIENTSETKNYCLCGDLNEYDEIKNLITSNVGGINLKNHGFLIYADTIENLKKYVFKLNFSYRRENDN